MLQTTILKSGPNQYRSASMQYGLQLAVKWEVGAINHEKVCQLKCN